MEAEHNPLEAFRQHFEQYMSYVSDGSRDASVLKVSYQFLSGNPDRALAEFVGFARRMDSPGGTVKFRIIPGFRR